MAPSGGGISFNGDTAAANALDDYEEGTWTPGIASGTVSSSDGRYIRIGNFVYLQGSINWPSTSSTNPANINNLPYAAGTGRAGSGVVRYTNNSSAGSYVFHVDTNATSCSLYNFGGAVVTQANMSGCRFDFVIYYSIL